MSADLDSQIASFEGLVFRTAQLVVAAGVEIDLDDARQFLRLKVWRAIERYSAPRDVRLRSLDRFVFGCVYNARLDLLKRPRRRDLSIEMIRSAGSCAAAEFDGRYLAESSESAFADIEDDPVGELGELGLHGLERQVAELLCCGFKLPEIESELGLEPGQAQVAVQAIRERLALLRPELPAQRTGPMRPLPGVEPQASPAPLALVA